MTGSLQYERMAIRLQLQAHRQQIAQKLFPLPQPPVPASASTSGLLVSPRSMTMRLLGRNTALVMVVVGELIPLLLRYYLRRSSQTA